MCVEANEALGKSTPCTTTTPPKTLTDYTLKDDLYTCNFKRPQLDFYESLIVDIYSQCSSARGDFGGLNYSVLIEIAKTYNLEDYDDLMEYAKECERLISEKREKESKNKK